MSEWNERNCVDDYCIAAALGSITGLSVLTYFTPRLRSARNHICTSATLAARNVNFRPISLYHHLIVTYKDEHMKISTIN
jgi:hypothetical protein